MTPLTLPLPAATVGAAPPTPGAPNAAAAISAGAAQSRQQAVEELRSLAISSDSVAGVDGTAAAAATALVREAAARQGGLATLYADLEAAVAQPDPALPQSILAAARQLLALRLDVESAGGIEAGDIKSALLRAGLVMPASGEDAALPQQPGSATLGAAMTALRLVLKSWLDAGAEKAALDQASQLTAAAPSIPRAAAPMPPYRDAPTVAQPPAAPSLPADASPRAQALHLLDETDAAIARQTLLQIASLPGDRAAVDVHDGSTALRLVFDIPVATAQGTAVAQMRIERDGKRETSQDIAPLWRANFSLDLKPIGPLHVRIAVSGARATVMLNAERADSAQRLAADLPLLEAGLRSAALEPGELSCHAGAPRGPAAAPGLFVDHAT